VVGAQTLKQFTAPKVFYKIISLEAADRLCYQSNVNPNMAGFDFAGQGRFPSNSSEGKIKLDFDHLQIFYFALFIAFIWYPKPIYHSIISHHTLTYL
jgi:hypothetical protein